MNKLWIIAKHIYVKNVKSWGFVAMVLMPVIMLAVIAGVSYYGAKTATGSYGDVAVITASPEIRQTLEEASIPNPLIFDMEVDAARQALLDKDIDLFMTIDEEGDALKVHYYDLEGEEAVNIAEVEAALNSYQTAKIGHEMNIDLQALKLLSQDHLMKETTHLKKGAEGQIMESSQDEMQEMIRLAFGYIAIFASFMFVVYYLQLIGQELAREKGTRVMEIIISSMSATHHFFGKLLGIIMMIATQIGIYVAVGVAAWYANKQYGWIDLSFLKLFDIQAILKQNQDIILWSLFFLIMSILIYISLGAFFASMASTAEDAQKMNAPITLLMVAGYYIGSFSLANPNNIVARIGSFVPMWTPYVMPLRLAKGGVTTFEMLLAAALSVLFVVLCFFLATTFYKTNVLTYSDKGLLGAMRRSFSLWKSEHQAKRTSK